MKEKNNPEKKKAGFPLYRQMPVSRRSAYIGVFIALSMVLSYVESLIPLTVAVPGVKLGLANLVTIVALFRLGLLPAVFVSVGRIILAGILFGNPTMILYSMAGAALSLAVMCLLKKLRVFTVTGVSIGGAVAHNAGQLFVATIFLESHVILYYMPVLALSGLVAGTVVGLLAAYLLKYLRFL